MKIISNFNVKPMVKAGKKFRGFPWPLSVVNNSRERSLDFINCYSSCGFPEVHRLELNPSMCQCPRLSPVWDVWVKGKCIGYFSQCCCKIHDKNKLRNDGFTLLTVRRCSTLWHGNQGSTPGWSQCIHSKMDKGWRQPQLIFSFLFILGPQTMEWCALG